MTYPRTDANPAFGVIGDDERTDVCKTCSFRPGAFSGIRDVAGNVNGAEVTQAAA